MASRSGRSSWDRAGVDLTALIHHVRLAFLRSGEARVFLVASPHTTKTRLVSDHAPAHYRVFRNFLLAFAPKFGNVEDAHLLVPQWNSLIDTSYAILEEAHCATTGLITNCAREVQVITPITES